MARAQKSAERRTKSQNPFEFGFRFETSGAMIPLTEDDLLHPREGDKVMEKDEHDADRAYLKYVFKSRTAKKPEVRVFSDHGIDFQRGDVQPLSPDIAVLVGEPLEWVDQGAVFPVADMNSHIRCIIELTSKSTRRTAMVRKAPLYYRGGVPLYIIADMPYSEIKRPRGLLPFKAGAKEYELLPLDSHGRFWLEVIGVWLAIENGRIVCFDADGKRIGDYTTVDEQRRIATELAETEKTLRLAGEARIRELEAQLKKSKKR